MTTFDVPPVDPMVSGLLAVPPPADPPDDWWHEADDDFTVAVKPEVDLSNEQVAYDELLKLIGQLPELYVRSGGLCWVKVEDGKPYVHQLGPDNLRAYLNRHVRAYVMKQVGRGKDTEWRQEPSLVMKSTCATLLAEKEWPAAPLRGIVTSPVLRPDGSLLQREGYDPDTGLYMVARLPLRHVPSNPTSKQIDDARKLLIDKVLHDFPFVHPSDKAQYVAGLLAPIMRPYIPGPTPLLAITASAPGTGKGALTSALDALYGMAGKPWPGHDDTELRKLVTTMLRNNGDPVMVFDNVDSGQGIRSRVLAELMTAKTWSDRVLGGNTEINMPNDRLWVANGNNLRTGGDMARRTLWVRLDAKMPNPDQRDTSKYAVGDLEHWLRKTANAVELLNSLLVLVSGWVAAGASTRNVNMANYGRWASTMAGLLDWAGVPDFLGARAETSVELDEETEEWHALLSTWHQHLSSPEPTKVVLATPAIAEHIPRVRGNELPSSLQFGKWLQARAGRFYGRYRLVRSMDSHTKSARWGVEKR